MKTHQHIAKKSPATTTPRPATTVTMIDSLWMRLFRLQTYHAQLDWLESFGDMVYADTSTAPFVIRLYHSNPRDRRVAYLTVAGGRVQWRFGSKSTGFHQCPVVSDVKTIVWLDSLFWWYANLNPEKKKTGRPSDLQRMVTERIRMMKKKQKLWNATHRN